MPNPQPPPRNEFCGRQVIWAGVVSGLGGLLLGLFLRTIVARTPNQLPGDALPWLVMVLAAMGTVAGMAVESVRQLQSSNPDPEYHQTRQLQRRLARERLQRRRTRNSGR
jgi:hypothetical protein